MNQKHLVSNLLDCIESEMYKLESSNDAQRQDVEISKEAKKALRELLPSVQSVILKHFNDGQFNI